jgi:uncharacterized protein (TIGR00255 family)
MKSMTGYGRSSNRSSDKKASKKNPSSIALDVSIRSVNGRFLETRLHLPREYVGLESDIKSIVARHFSRGTVDVYVNRSRSEVSSEINVNRKLAVKWLKGYRELGAALKLKEEPSLELLAKVPDIFKFEDRAEATDAETKLVKKLTEASAQACAQEREREGRALAAELQRLCSRLERLVDEMETLRAEANADLEKRYKDRLQKLGFKGIVDDQRIAQEIVMQLDRAEISEELTRLREHLKAYSQLLKTEESQGKKLDFYAQELLREVNTIGSKSQVAKLTSLVVDAKTVVEKIREQVQNVE